MAHAKRGIFSDAILQVTKNKGSYSVHDLHTALELIKNSALNSSNTFSASVKGDPNHAWTVKIEENTNPKRRIHIPAGLYDLYW